MGIDDGSDITNDSARRPGRLVLRLAVIVVVLFAAGFVVFLFVLPQQHSERERSTTTQPVTRPASAPATAPTAPVIPRDYMGVVLRRYPDFPTTQPLIIPLENFSDAARLVFDQPIYLDSSRDLWLTEPTAPPASAVLSSVTFGRDQVHLTRDRVVFAYYVSESDKPQPHVIVQRSDGSLEDVSRAGRIEVGTPGRAYDWDRAVKVVQGANDMIVVPTDRGVSVLRPQSRPMEAYQELELADAAPTTASTTAPATAPATSPTTHSVAVKPQYRFLSRGVIAWIPTERGRDGSRGAARYADGRWTPLGREQGWPERILTVIPRYDGSIVVLEVSDDGTVTTELLVLDPVVQFEESAIAALVEKLSDPDPKVRDAAHDELTLFGTGVFPFLEKVREQQPPEAQLRIAQLLRAKSEPTLGQLLLEPGKIHAVSWMNDRSSLLYAESGVSIPDVANAGAEPRHVAPAWIFIPSIAAATLAPDALVAGLKPDAARIIGNADEQLVIHDVLGPQRLLGNHLAPMLPRSLASYNDLVGVDARRRWLFRKTPSDATTLIIDPTLPDPTPRLPVWHYPVEGGSVGWTRDGWPAVKSGGAWVIERDGTRPLNEATEPMLSDEADIPEPATLPATLPTTRPAALAATAPATQPATLPVERPVLVDANGGFYWGGQDVLRYLPRAGGEIITWPLPYEAVGAGEVHLIEAENRLFLFNEPGRVIRLRRNAGNAAEPFTYETTFTRNLPNVDHATRVWLDPAGRIVMAYEGNRLAIMFPSGMIPQSIAQKMLATDLKANEPE